MPLAPRSPKAHHTLALGHDDEPRQVCRVENASTRMGDSVSPL
jgi:hypothetical protein